MERESVSEDRAPLLERAFDLELREESYDLEPSRGEVPAYVRGTYYLNGPAMTRRGAVRYRHWLDPDGMVSALSFGDGGVRFTNRFVRSTKFTAEEAAGGAIYRAFGTAFEGDQLKRGIGLESPVNVSVYRWQDALLAFGEQGLPWELDPETLETRGEYTFGHRLNPISPLSAHPHVDWSTGEMWNFGVSFSATHPSLTVYCFAADGSLALRRRLPLDHPCSMHDFGLAPRHAVFYLSPYLLDVGALLRHDRTLMDSLAWRPELGSRLLVVARDGGEPVASVDVGSSYCLHLANCFERDGLLFVDLIELDRPVYDQYNIPDGFFTEVRRAWPKRYAVDLERGELAESAELGYRNMCDFPAIDPRRATRETRDVWLLGISATEKPGRKFFDQVVHCDWASGDVEVYQAPPRCYLGGEPVFLGDPEDEGRGAVICQRFDAERREMSFLLFDAFDVARGPVAELPLRRPVPLGFHASFDPDWNGGYGPG
jgi:carotenoid cleavage dioxygenase-like enzyme